MIFNAWELGERAPKNVHFIGLLDLSVCVLFVCLSVPKDNSVVTLVVTHTTADNICSCCLITG